MIIKEENSNVGSGANDEQKDELMDEDDNSNGDLGVDKYSDSESSSGYEDSGDEAWPISNTRYAPIGDAKSKVSMKGSYRLAREFTIGSGFYHLTNEGQRIVYESEIRTITRYYLSFLFGSDSNNNYYNNTAINLMKKNDLQTKCLFISKLTYIRLTR